MVQAMAASITSAAEPADDFYGDRLTRITAPHGDRWSIFPHIEVLTPDQIAHRLSSLSSASPPKKRRQRSLCRTHIEPT